MSATYSKGRYQAEILDQGFGESSVKHTPCFFLQLRILGRYGADDRVQECPCYEHTYTQYLANDTGVHILKADLKAIGLEITDLAQLDPSCPNCANLIGRTINVVCKLENDRGKETERWSLRSRKKLDLDTVRTLNDRFGHLLRDGNAQTKPASGVTTPNTSNDVF